MPFMFNVLQRKFYMLRKISTVTHVFYVIVNMMYYLNPLYTGNLLRCHCNNFKKEINHKSIYSSFCYSGCKVTNKKIFFFISGCFCM